MLDSSGRGGSMPGCSRGRGRYDSLGGGTLDS